MPDDTTPYDVTTDLDRIDLDVVHRWLSTDAYWALGRTRGTVRTAARNSLNVGVLDADGALCANARVVTDRATFAWLCDVYVDPAHRGRGVGHLLVDSVVDLLEPFDLGRTLLATRDAHGLYASVGFAPLAEPQRWMVRLRE